MSWWTPAPETAVEEAWGRRPFSHRLGAALGVSACMLVVLLLLARFGEHLFFAPATHLHPRIARGLIPQVVILAAVVALTQVTVGFRNIGLQLRGAAASSLLALPVLALSLADAKPTGAHGPAVVAVVVVWATVIGFCEEAYGRGLLVTLLGGRKHAGLAVIGSAIGFADLHLPSYVPAYGFRDAMLRCAISSAFAAVFAIVRLRSGSLGGPILFHAINDTQSILVDLETQRRGPMSMQPLFVGLVLAAVYWFACRRAIRDGAS